MLRLLKINNIALIDKLEIEFDKGLNVLTGETGAGKSIIFDSLNFVLGARSDKSLIRNGESTARVEAVFDIKTNEQCKTILNQFDIEYDDQLILSRTMSIDGKAEIRVNGCSVTVNMLKEISSCLVDIYGQQEQVSLLKPKYQLSLVDMYAGKEFAKNILKYQSVLKDYKGVIKQLDELGGDISATMREKDYLAFVIREIEAEKISENEKQELLEQSKKFGNMEKIVSASATMENALSNSSPLISQSIMACGNVNSYDSQLDDLYERLKSLKIELDDIYDTVASYRDSLDFNQYTFDKIDARLEVYKKLEKKYGGSVQGILNFLEDAKSKLSLLENSQLIREDLENQKNSLLKELFVLAKHLYDERLSVSAKLSKKLQDNLKQLGMPNAKIEFVFEDFVESPDKLTLTGIGQVDIKFNANLGQDIKSLSKVASGGELSRVMLAIKSVVAELDNMPTMIFDEIDTGISGKMAQSVAEKMAQISKYHQVIVITHTIQIATMADNHYLIEKMEKNGTTISRVKLLNYEEKVGEIARFMSVDETTEFTKENARQLLQSQEKYKQSIWHFLLTNCGI